MPPTTTTPPTTPCAVCESRSRYGPAVTTDGGKPVCFFHAPQDWRDGVVIAREMTTFIGWHDEQATRHDGLAAETKKPQSKDKNRALAEAHRLAADAIRKALRVRVPDTQAPAAPGGRAVRLIEGAKGPDESDDYDPR